MAVFEENRFLSGGLRQTQKCFCNPADLGAHGEASDVEDEKQHSRDEPLLGAQLGEGVEDSCRQIPNASKLSVTWGAL